MKSFINIHLKSLRIGLLAAWLFGLTTCAEADPGTRADRDALFDVIVAKIMAREAFSPIKNQRLGLSFPESLESHRAPFIDANTDKELYWALVQLLDQFSAITCDNDLCTDIGMPTGGYSNTWEWEEVLTFPISGKPVVTFMWNIGQTIRPKGEVLEGIPPKVDDYIPLTAENHETYYEPLMARSRAILEQHGNAAPKTSGR